MGLNNEQSNINDTIIIRISELFRGVIRNEQFLC